MVGDADTAIAMCSGEVPVLATPRLIALCEEAAVKAVAERLQPGETTVGARVEFTHLAPTAVGHQVTAEATLGEVHGRRLVFTVSVDDKSGLVGAGRITRVIVNRAEFIEKAG